MCERHVFTYKRSSLFSCTNVENFPINQCEMATNDQAVAATAGKNLAGCVMELGGKVGTAYYYKMLAVSGVVI